ncbi:MAG: flagellar hook-associated protein 3 [FCB group bacterium]|nr:flagellar hook-associated protein 3 [FCB group bacterium]
MRVTNQMMVDRAVFNLANSVNRLMRIENQLSTGRRINTASDDPIGTQHDLNYRARLREISQYTSNVGMGAGALTSYENDLGNINDIFNSAKEIALMMANDTYDENARAAAAVEVESLFEQLTQIGNSKVDGRYMYSGNLTHTEPLELAANGVIYRGDTGVRSLTVDTNSRIATSLYGEQVYFKQINILGENSELNLGLSASTQLTDLNMGAGVDLTSGVFPGGFAIHDHNRNVTYLIDVSGCATMDDVVNAINNPATGLPADSNLSVRISDSGASLTLEPVIGTLNTVTDDTDLANLNQGTGVDQLLGSFRIHNGDDSIDFDVDVSTATNMGEVVTAIENALDGALGAGHGITVGYNADGTGLQITDTNGVPLDLTIEDYTDQDSTTAADLGLTGNLDPDLIGTDLRPQPSFEIRDIAAQTTAADIGLLGSFTGNKVGEDLNPRLTTDALLAALNNKNGHELGDIKISQGTRTVTIDLNDPTIVTVGDLLAAINSSGLDVTATINAGETGIRIDSTITGQTLIVENGDSTNSASQLGIAGSTDMLGSLMLLNTALQNNDRDLAEQLVGTLDDVMQEVLVSRGGVGARLNQLEMTLGRHEATALNLQKLLSDVEDADIVTLVTDLAKEENYYQAALMATSKVIQPSLLDFL